MLDKIKSMLGVNDANLGNGKSVLIVDDSEIDRKVVKKALESTKFSIDLAHNGKEGFEKAKTQRPDIIILDCEMPEMGGVEMCKQLRENTETEKIPVIFLTSLNTPANIVDCFELDADNYLTKPITPKLLLSHIKSIIEETK